MRRRLRIAGWVLLAWMLIHVLYVCIDGLHDYQGNADIAIVLGNRVDPDSSLSPALKGRVDKALLLYREGRVERIMVSGGQGKAEGMGGVPEGMAMKRYLVAHGVPADRIVEDNDGENTYLTAKDFLPVADSLHIHSAIAVSSFYHLTRTKYIIHHVGFRGDVHSVSSDVYFWNDLAGLPRDCVAFYKYLVVY
ncbi:MAG TPA: YdcF family protein [Puia sp.]|jgi:uncharacterized SAM-binding protein YcdF (DUF218 family)|nr:YdcF family protein [Puia sp.]